jgi:hypothetical protein
MYCTFTYLYSINMDISVWKTSRTWHCMYLFKYMYINLQYRVLYKFINIKGKLRTGYRKYLFTFIVSLRTAFIIRTIRLFVSQ